MRFLEEPVRYPWGGIGVRFLDQDGSFIFLQQESAGSPPTFDTAEQVAGIVTKAVAES